MTLTGAGGCGKTRLALQTAAETVDRYPDGLWSVELAATSHAEEVAQAVARVLGLRDEHGRPLVDTLAEQLRDLDVLLVLDNCEQVLDGTARLVERLLHLAPRLRVLATSREPLGVEGEVTWRSSRRSTTTPDAPSSPTARLRRGRASTQTPPSKASSRRSCPGSTGSPWPSSSPPRGRMMRPSRILAALDDRFRLLTGGSRTMMPRQQTLEASVAWSYDLLDEAEQTLARRLSILHGFTLETAEAVGSDDAIDEYAVLELLTRLVDKSLVHVVETGADTRYRMLETVRQFLHGHLIAEGEAEPVRQRQLTHFLGVAELLAPALAFADGPNHLARLQADHDNLEDALEWAASTGSGESMLRLATALTLFWELRGHLVSGGRWFLRALGADDAEVSVIRARALWGAAHVAFYGGDYETALQRAGQSLAMAETVGDDWAAARALNTVGVMQALDSPVAARESLERSIEFGESIGDRWAVADGWKMLTVAWQVQHDAVGIRAPLDQLRRTGEQLGSPFFLAWYEVMVGYFARDRGDYATARTAFERSLEYCRAFGEPSTAGFAEVWLAALDADEGALDAASRKPFRVSRPGRGVRRRARHSRRRVRARPDRALDRRHRRSPRHRRALHRCRTRGRGARLGLAGTHRARRGTPSRRRHRRRDGRARRSRRVGDASRERLSRRTDRLRTGAGRTPAG